MAGSLAGKLLVASPILDDPNFFRTVVLLIDHDEEGAVGVVLNRPSESDVTEHLPAWSALAAPPTVVFVGGPVEPEVAIGLERTTEARRPGPLDGLGLADLSDPETATSPVRVFSGYAGWGSGQLEAELSEQAWMVVEAEIEDVFLPDPRRLWSQVLRRQEGPLRLLASYPPDLGMN